MSPMDLLFALALAAVITWALRDLLRAFGMVLRDEAEREDRA